MTTLLSDGLVQRTWGRYGLSPRNGSLVRGGCPLGAGTAYTGSWTTPSRRTAAARNMAALRRIALNFLTLLKQYFWPNMSIRWLRKMVVRNPARLEPILTL